MEQICCLLPRTMSVASSLFSSISGYIPTAVKEAAGLSPQISEAVRHITWLSIERIFWPEVHRKPFLGSW